MSPERSKEQEHPKGVDSQTTIRAPAIGAYESASMVEDAGVYLVAIEGPNTGRWVPLGADPVTVGHDPHLDLSLSRPIRGRRLSADRYVPVTWRAYASGNMTIVRDIVEMEVTGLDNGLTKIVFSGRLDTPGVDRVEARFVAAVVPGSKSAIVDISGSSSWRRWESGCSLPLRGAWLCTRRSWRSTARSRW